MIGPWSHVGAVIFGIWLAHYEGRVEKWIVNDINAIRAERGMPPLLYTVRRVGAAKNSTKCSYAHKNGICLYMNRLRVDGLVIKSQKVVGLTQLLHLRSLTQAGEKIKFDLAPTTIIGRILVSISG